MNLKYVIPAIAGIMAATALNLSAQQSDNVNATQPFGQTAIQPQIRLNLENDTDKVHFIRNNTDPFVVTKVYQVKNCDVYELRPFVTSAVRAKKITQDNTYVECIRYNNGEGFLIVSAEAYRFGPQESGMGIDEIVKTLDQPKLVYSTGTNRYLYFPKYRSAAELSTLLINVGATTAYNPATTGVPYYAMDSSWELQRGKDQVLVEPSLNALFISTPPWSKKNIDAMLQYYDQPILQAEIKFTIYEIYAENDGKLGADFQDWKNNDGVDLLSVGGRYRSNWASTFSGGIDQNGSNKTQFFNLNPKWNSKYLDFLVSRSKAKVRNAGTVLIKNNQTAVINSSTRVFYDQYVPTSDKTLAQYITAGDQIKSLGTASTTGSANYKFSAFVDGKEITILGGIAAATSISAVRIAISPTTYRYQLAITGPVSFVSNGHNFGQQMDADVFSLSKNTPYLVPAAATNTTTPGPNNTWVDNYVALSWVDDINVAKGPTINTLPSNTFGFVMTIQPQICQDATNLTVNIVNSSLIGWKSNGDPRIANTDTISTEIMIGNKGNRFVIGGINKQTVVRSVTGIPVLRELPGLGWLFSTESESTKKSQLVVAAVCNIKAIDAILTEAVSDSIKKIEKGTENSGEKIKWGYDQYLLDKKM